MRWLQRLPALVRKNIELIFWIAALMVLYGMRVEGSGHFTLCAFRLLGWDHCPGCGIGRSIHALLHGDWALSWQYHWFGFPALLIIIVRIFSLIKQQQHVKPPKPAHDYSRSPA